MWHKRAHPLAAASPARERAISLSLPRSNGASQSGDTIIASTIQFPLSIIYCLCRTCRKRRRRWKSRFLSGGTESTPRQSPARRFSRDLRARPYLRGRALTRRAAPLSVSVPVPGWAKPPRDRWNWAPAGRLQKVTGVTLPGALINKQCLILSWLHS